MNANRIWAIVTVMVIAAVLVLGWILGISPLLAQAATADAERATVEQTNAAETARLERMRQIARDVEALEAELAELRVSVPAELDSDAMYRLFADIQDASGAAVKAVATTDAVPYGSQVGDAGGVPQPTPAGGESATASAPVPAELHTVPLSFTFEQHSVEQVMAFVEGLQASPRLFLVTDVTADSTSTSTITAYMFVMHDPSASRFATKGSTPTP